MHDIVNCRGSLTHLYRGDGIKRLVEVAVVRSSDDNEFIEVCLGDFTEVARGKAEAVHEAATHSQGLPSL